MAVSLPSCVTLSKSLSQSHSNEPDPQPQLTSMCLMSEPSITIHIPGLCPCYSLPLRMPFSLRHLIHSYLFVRTQLTCLRGFHEASCSLSYANTPILFYYNNISTERLCCPCMVFLFVFCLFYNSFTGP